MSERKFYTKKIADAARRFYLEEKTADFCKTALYISSIFHKQFNKYDISKMFKYIVILGNNSKTAEELVHEINIRNKYSNPYNSFLNLRKFYLKNKIKLYFIEKTLDEARLYEELDFSYFEFSQDEAELSRYKQYLSKSYEIAKNIDISEYNEIISCIQEIEKKYKLVD